MVNFALYPCLDIPSQIPEKVRVNMLLSAVCLLVTHLLLSFFQVAIEHVLRPHPLDGPVFSIKMSD